MPKHVIVLSENDIARIINGEEVSTKINGEEVKIRQSHMKDLTKDVLVRKFRVMDTVSNTFAY